MRLVTLVENTANRVGLVGEHGLACLIEVGEESVLWDTGQGNALLPNAEKLEVDLASLAGIALSHGHFDHSGGLQELLTRIGPRTVWAHPAAFVGKFAVRAGEAERDIGMPNPRAELEAAGARVQTFEGPTELVPGVLASGAVPRVTDFEPVSPRFKVRENGSFAPDLLPDDQFLVVESAAGPVVVLGCAHSGLINTLLYAAELARTRHFAAVVGGTHLVDADEVRLERTATELRQFDIDCLAACHCTGFRGQVALWQAFGERFRVVNTGDVLES